MPPHHAHSIICKQAIANQPAVQGKFVWGKGRNAGVPESGSRPADMNSFVRLKPGMRSKHHVDVGEAITVDNHHVTVVFGRLFTWPGLSDKDPELRHPARLISRCMREKTALPLPLAGEFAIAHWDEQEQTLELMTDVSGTRPLFYVANARGVAFASDIRSLLDHCDNPDKLDEQMMNCFLSSDRSCPKSHTLVDEIRIVPPATAVKITPSGTKAEQYWSIENAPSTRFSQHGDYFEKARELLTQSVVRRSTFDTGIGAHLSGGLDSGAICAIASQTRRDQGLEPPLGYAWQPVIENNTEALIDQKNLELCRTAFGMECIYRQSTLQDQLEFIGLEPVSSPFTSTLALELSVIRDAGERDLGLMLSGWGGDQVFSYNGAAPYRATPGGFFKVLVKTGISAFRDNGPFYKKGRVKREPLLSSLRRAARRRTTMGAQVDNFLDQTTAERLTAWSIAAAKHDLQYSFPLLDHDLLEFAVGLPPELFRTHREKRILMRETLRGLIPEEVRLHSVKDDPARLANTMDVYRQFFPHCRRLLEQGKYDEVRASYLDVNRMIDDLKIYETSGQIKFGRIVRALSFIKLDTA